MVTAPYFMATKIEAFYGRGGDDFLGSHDMEDIITVIDGRPDNGKVHIGHPAYKIFYLLVPLFLL